MRFYKKILAFTFMLSLLLLVGCNNSNTNNTISTNFPTDEMGYPQKNVVIINGEQYSLKNIENAIVDSQISYEIDLKLEEDSDVIDITLPKNSIITMWSVDPNVNLISYNKIELPISNTNILEGESPTLQNFKIVVAKDENSSISFKLANVNENEKSFKDKKENYLLKLNISY